MMKIAYVCADRGVPVFGTKGCSIHVQEILRALLDYGCQIDVFAARLGGEAPVDLKHISVHPLPRISKNTATEYEKNALASNDETWQLLHDKGPYDMVYERYSLWSTAGMQYARECSIPGVLEVNAPLIEEQAQHRTLVDRTAAEQSTQQTFEWASLLVAVSEEVARYIAQFPKTDGSIVVIPNGINPKRFPEHVSPLYPSDRDVMTIGFVGSLKPWHGLKDLVEAFDQLYRKDAHVRLLIVGDGPNREELLEDLNQRNLRDACVLTGSLHHDDIPRCLASMDVAVAPYPELTQFYFSPLKVYEYMAAGLPVVASDIGQLHHLIVHEKNGLLSPPSDPKSLCNALERLRDDVSLRHALGSAGRQTVLNQYTWDQNIQMIMGHLNKLQLTQQYVQEVL